MGTAGTIGTVRAALEADTRGFDAAIKSASAKLGEVGDQATAAGQKVDASMRVQEAAAQRAQRAFQRELQTQDQAAQKTAALARAQELAAFKADIIARSEAAAADALEREAAAASAAEAANLRNALSSQKVSAESMRVVETLQAQSTAQQQLARVQALVGEGAIAESESIGLLAAAQGRVTATTAEVAAAKRAEATASKEAASAVEAANLRAALSSQKVSQESLRSVEAVQAQAAAQQQLARVQALVGEGAIAESESIGLLASAQGRVTAATAEVAAAKRAEAVAVKQAAEEEALSQNVVIRALQRVALVAKESLSEVREQLMQTVEAAGLESEGISAGFAGLSKLFGAGIAVGFAAEYIDGLAKMNVELDHLSEKTGISVTALAGLQQLVRQMGSEWDPVTIGLVRMQKAQVAAIGGAKSHANAQTKAFADIGISVKELEHMSPEQLFVRVGSAIGHVEQPAVAASSAIGIFGRGGAALIPIFKAQGDQLEANMKKTGEMTGITDKSAEAARRWTEDVAKLSAQFRSVMIPVMEHAEDVVKGIGGAFMAAFAAVDTVLETAAAGIVSIVVGIGSVAKVLNDVRSFNFTAASQDAAGAKDKFVGVWKDAFGDIGREWKKTSDLFFKKTPAPPHTEGSDDTDLSGSEGQGKVHAGHAQRDAAREQLDEFEHGMAEMEEAGKADVFHLRAYWAKKLEATQQGSADYNKVAGSLNYDKVFAKLAEATKRMDAELEKSLHPKASGDDSFLREQEHFAEEQAHKVAEIRQRAADEQAKLAERGQLADLSIAVSHGEISRYQSLVAEAQIHAAAFGAEIADVERRLAEAEALHDLPGMQEEIAKLQAQRAQLRTEAAQQARQDRSEIESNTAAGAFSDALHEWVQQSQDAAGLVRKAFAETASGINDSLAKAFTDPARTGHERMMNLRNSLSGSFRSVADQGIEFSLGKLETGILGGLGVGKKKPTGAKGDAFHVIVDDAREAASKAGGVAESGINAGLHKLGIPTGPGSTVGSIESGIGGIFHGIFGGSNAAAAAAPAKAAQVAAIIAGGGEGGSPASTAALDLLGLLPSYRGANVAGPAGTGAPSDAGAASGILASILPAFGGTASSDTGDTASSSPDFLSGLPSITDGAPSLTAGMPDDATQFKSIDQVPGLPGDLNTMITRPDNSTANAVGGGVSKATSMLLGLLPGFAGGGSIVPDMGPFITGEEGPEILNIGSMSGHVTPNNKLRSLGGGGDTHHTWNIDARGATDPAMVRQMVMDGIQTAAPHIARAAMQGTTENRRRTATTSR